MLIRELFTLGGKQYTSVSQCAFGDTAIRITITLQGKMPGICFGCYENEKELGLEGINCLFQA